MANNNRFDRAQLLGRLQGTRAIGESANLKDKVDFFSFRVGRRSSFQGILRGLKGNVDLALFDSDRKRIAFSNNPGQQSEKIDTILEQGRYFIKTTHVRGQTQYRLRLSLTPLDAPNPATAKFVGLTSDNGLAFFNNDNLDNVTRLSVTGLQAGENLLGVDFRPNNGQLFGLGSTSRLYSIDLTTGAATQVGTQPFALPLSGTSFGFDFNPAVDRIRIVSNTGQNLRANPDTGALVDADLVTPGVQTDGSLNGGTTSIMASAYTNSFSGTPSTTLFGIDTNTDQLFTQNPPNAGTQVLVGPLGVDFTANAAFDIVTQNGINTAYAVSDSSLYTVDLTTGAATLTGTLRDIRTPLNLVGLAVRA